MKGTQLVQKVASISGYHFKNPTLIEQALNHDSNRVNNRDILTYQRLEFLGDSVLNLIISDYLFRKNVNSNEGDLTQQRKELTQGTKQAEIATAINIKDLISFGQSVNKDTFSRYDKFVESLIGAVYIEGGIEEARRVIYRLWKLQQEDLPDPAQHGCVLS